MSEDGPNPSRGQALIAMAMVLDVEVVRHGNRWAESSINDAMVELAAQAAFTASPPKTPALYEATIVLTDDAEMRELNRTWRNKDQPTNVLSFPASDAPGESAAVGGSTALGECAHLGDVVIAFETTCAEAAEKSLSLSDHVSHLVVHGVLHLLGFDHHEDNEAEQMERLERMALASLGIADPYGIEDGPEIDGKADFAEMEQ